MPSELRVDNINSTTSPYDPVFSTTGGALSHRNMIINGGMTVAQRGTGFSAIHDTQFAADRFKFSCANEDQLRLSITRESSGPTGFSNSIRLNVTTEETAIDSNEYARITTGIEGQDLQHLDYGASGAKTTTLSFYVKSALAGTYAIVLYQNNGAKNIGTTYTINTADTWEKKTITFVGNTAQAIANDNTLGIQIEWILMVGSTYTGTANTSWDTFANGRWANGHTAAWGTNTSHDFWLSGVQWEVGTVATPFEHRSYADELQRCMRYYCQLGSIIGTGYQNGSSQLIVPLGDAGVQDASLNSGAIAMGSVPFRATPTISGTLGTASFANHSGNAEFVSDTLNTIQASTTGTMTLTIHGTFSTNGQNDNSSMTCYYNGKTINVESEI